MGQALTRKQYLLDMCNDYHLPVSPADNEEVLENYLKAVGDESPEADVEDSFLENDPVYIGKYESAILAYFRRIIRSV